MMRFRTGVDIPDALIDAHNNGQLVFFIGAGVSFDPPANLPLFTQLADELANLAIFEKPENGIALDSYLGSFPNGFDIQKHTRRIIEAPSSRPNDLHKTILRLSTQTGHCRIVTTNFDVLLEEATSELEFSQPPVWNSPNLPAGDNFHGIVHIHGSVSCEDRLILTDADFGSAYLSNGWARDFLMNLFSKYTVLFIGYSLQDPLMNYLTMGLDHFQSSKLYCLINSESANSDIWKRRRVKTISYPLKPDQDHSALGETLNEWANLRSDFSNESNLKGLFVSGLENEDDQKYLLDYMVNFKNLDLLNAGFKNLTDQQKVEWLEILSTNGYFDSLFEGIDNSASRYWCDLLINTFVTSETLSEIALKLIISRVEHIGDYFLAELIIGIRKLPSPFVTKYLVWLSTLWNSRKLDQRIPFSLIRLAEFHPIPSVFLRTLLSARLTTNEVVSKKLSIKTQVVPKLKPLIPPFYSTRLLNTLMAKPDANTTLIGETLIESIDTTSSLLRLSYSGTVPIDDPLSATRLASLSSETTTRDHLAVLATALNQILEANQTWAANKMGDFWKSESTLLKRFALKILKESQALSPEEKLHWIKAEPSFLSANCWLEKLDLVKEIHNDDTASLKLEILDWLSEEKAKLEAASVSPDRTIWIQRVASFLKIDLGSLGFDEDQLAGQSHPEVKNSSISDVLESIRAGNIDELNSFFSSPRMILDQNGFRYQSVEEIINDAITITSNIEYASLLWNLSHLEHFALATPVRSLLFSNQSVRDQAKHEVLLGWATELCNSSECLAEITTWLSQSIERVEEIHDLVELKQIAIQAHHKLESSELVEANTVEVPSQISWAGCLVVFWLKALLFEKDKNASADEIMSSEKIIHELITHASLPTRADACIPILENLPLSHYLVPKLVDGLITSQLNSDDKEILRSSWQCYLHNPKISKNLINEPFISGLKKIWLQHKTLSDDLLDNLIRITALAFHLMARTNDPDFEFINFAIASSENKVGGRLMRLIFNEVTEEDLLSDKKWNQAIFPYLIMRVEGIPRDPSLEEFQALSDFASVSKNRFSELVRLIGENIRPFTEDTPLIDFEFNRPEVTFNSPKEWEDFASFTLKRIRLTDHPEIKEAAIESLLNVCEGKVDSSICNQIKSQLPKGRQHFD